MTWAVTPPTVVISQVYGGGGNSGATWKNDFIELFNSGTTAVDLSTWSVQYGSSGGTTWSKTTLPPGAMIQPGHYILIQEAAGSGGTTPLPTPDATGSIAMSATAAKVALVSNTTTLSGACPSSPAIVDLVGYGGANCSGGGSPVPALSNTTAALRLASGCAFTGTNLVDFTTGDPAPRNSASQPTFCSTGSASPSALALGATTLLTAVPFPGLTPTSMAASLDTVGGSGTQILFDDGTHGDVTAGDGTFSATISIGQCSLTGARFIPVSITYSDGSSGAAPIPLNIAAPSPVTAAIFTIQGSGPRSPYECLPVITTGVVTYVKSDGFYLQDPVGDADPATSDGVFVYTGSTPPAAAALGNSVRVAGTVQEYVPSADPGSPPTTEIDRSPTVTVLSSGNPLPDAVEITSIDPNGAFDQLERYEGMRVHVASLTITGPTLGNITESSATSASTGLFFGVLSGTPRPFREAGIEAPDPIPVPPCCIPRFDANPERLRIDTSRLTPKLEVTAGATVTNITGPVDFGYRMYSIIAEPGIAATPNSSFVAVPAPDPSEFTVANMNLQRFYNTPTLTPTAFANRLNKVSLAVRNVLHSPDIIGLEEMRDLATLQDLANKINSDAVAAGDPDPGYTGYLYDGNDISNINVALLVKPRINVSSVTQYGKTDTLPGTSSIMNDRPPIVLSGWVENQGETMPFYVIVNHLRSLSGIEDPAGIARPKRRAQAEFLADLIQNTLGNSSANIISVGDYNAFEFNDGYVDVMGTILGMPAPADQVVLASADLVDPNLTDLLTLLPSQQHYSYTYDGNGQVLDHVLVNSNLLPQVTRFAYGRNNADFPDSFRNDPARPERYADHDMPVAYIKLPTDHTPPVLTLPADISVLADSAAGTVVTFTATANDSWDGALPVTCLPASGATFPVGGTTVHCSATDAHLNTATGSFHVQVSYVFGGFTSPLGNGISGPFKAGSTVPVKWQLSYGTGAPVTSPAAVQSIQAASNSACSGAADGAAFPAASAGGSVLRYDASANQFVFNWKTGSTLAAGCYNLTLNLADGNSYSVIVSLK